MPDPRFPQILPLGLSGVLVRFADRPDDKANLAALALAAAVEDAAWTGVTETAPSLASLFVGVDPGRADPAQIAARLTDLLSTRDWAAAPLPAGRRLWRVPCAFGGKEGPQLREAAMLAGLGSEAAVAQICATPVRVLALGFSPGQPYLGTLPAAWDIPRQTGLTRTVPTGALVVAVRQLIVFTAPSPTGWRRIGQTALQGFCPERDPPALLRPGDAVQIVPVSATEIESTPAPGATCGPLS